MSSSEVYIQQLGSVGFPAAPEVVLRLSQLLRTEWVRAEQLAEVAMLDATVSARVLRLANSVYYRGKGVKSIAEAVIRIGIDGVRDVVYALSLMRTLRPMQFSHRQYWRHCLAVAQATQILQLRARKAVVSPSELHAAGLLHDIGMLVLDRTLGVGYGRILANAHESGRPLFEVEREMIDTDHADVGARLLETWHLPESLVQATAAHHDPAGEGEPAAQIVYLADFVCNLHAVHHGTAYRPEGSVSDVWSALGIDERELPEILTEVDASLDKADAILAVAA
ncbi:MAG TPA: HDOD domain-containing protein [Opitutaceae bacterium]|nr:HDOD domain-containing protein [Opitutaceae bacterium]